MQRLYAFLLLFLNAVLWVLVAIISPLYLLLHALYQTLQTMLRTPLNSPGRDSNPSLKLILKKGKKT